MPHPDYVMKKGEVILWMTQASKRVDEFDCDCEKVALFDRFSAVGECANCGRVYRQVGGPTIITDPEIIRVCEVDESNLIDVYAAKKQRPDTLKQIEGLEHMLRTLAGSPNPLSEADDEQKFEFTPKALFLSTVGVPSLEEGEKVWEGFKELATDYAKQRGLAQPENSVPAMIMTDVGVFAFAELKEESDSAGPDAT